MFAFELIVILCGNHMHEHESDNSDTNDDRPSACNFNSGETMDLNSNTSNTSDGTECKIDDKIYEIY